MQKSKMISDLDLCGHCVGSKVCIKSPCTVSTALLALIEVHELLIQTLHKDLLLC